MNKVYRNVTLLAAATLLTACAKNPASPQDPYEPFNRQVFNFNKTFDKTVMKPAALTYEKITPHFVRTGVTNFFNNLATPKDFINDALQGRGKFALIAINRFLINSTIGIAGLFDVATKMGIPKHRNDFGKTFAYWTGDDKSTYIMLPFLGPSTFRDTLALPFDSATNPLFYCKNDAVTYGGTALDLVNFRTNLLPSDPVIYNAFDPYAAMRNAYLQTRNAAIIQNNVMGDYHRGMELEHSDFENPYKQAMQTPEVDEPFTFD